MKNKRKATITAALTFLMLSITAPALLVNPASAETQSLQASAGPYREGQWWKIQTGSITLLFPASGKKPMFLWWYTNNTENIFVVKYKGLIEYLVHEQPYYLHRYQADNMTIRERLEAMYGTEGPHMTQVMQQIRNFMTTHYMDFHPVYLPFNACLWNLTGPVNVQRDDGVSYVSFNFTLVQAPWRFEYAENNVIIRCRFYETNATENVRGLYNYTVNAGELKMDLVVKNWQWNVDTLSELYDFLSTNLGISIEPLHAGLALWVNMASIHIEDMPIAEQDAASTSDIIEPNSQTSDIIAGGQRIQVQTNQTAAGADEAPIRERLRERFRLQYARGSRTLAGFFDFVDKATVIDPATDEASLVNVTGAYIPAGAHMRVFLCYPYFGANILEHDPTIGVENVVAWIPPYLLLVLIGATVVVAVAIGAVKLRKKTVNVLNVP